MAKRIVYKGGNLERITQWIREAEGRATVRTVSVRSMGAALKAAEDRLLAVAAKKSLKGSKLSVDINAQDFPSAYRYTPESTHFEAVYNGREWVITSIERKRCRGSAQKCICHLTEEAKESIIASYTQFAVC